MDEVLRAVGWEPRMAHRLRVFAYPVALSTAFTVLGYLVARPLGSLLWVAQLAYWIPWLYWLGYGFPRHHRHRQPGSEGGRAYRQAFFLHVGPGISWNFAQMARPALVGIVQVGAMPPAMPPFLVGVALMGVGGAMIHLALRTIGVSRALFLGEYEPSARHLVTTGIYARIRHPLFLGGILTSIGGALVWPSRQSLALAGANVAVLPFYRILEDARCRQVYNQYGGYQDRVGGIVPTIRARVEPARGSRG